MPRLVSALAIVPALLLVFPAPAAAQDFKPKKSAIPDAEVDAAIAKGTAWLKGAVAGKEAPKGFRGEPADELVLYTLVHGGLPQDDPIFQELLQRVVNRNPPRTYTAACGAMCLAALDKAGYQWKLEQYAQFLVDNQCKNGQWSYGEPVEFPPPRIITPSRNQEKVVTGPDGREIKRPEVARLYGTRPPAGEAKGTRTLPKRMVMRRKQGPPQGDNSNSQYAALGLRACAEAGILADPQCTQDALNWWAGHQNDDGGWGYDAGLNSSFGSMTVGGIGAVAIYDWMLRRPWKRDPSIAKGLQWLQTNWDVTANPKGAPFGRGFYLDYYLYGIERVGMLVGTDMIGPHDWYDEGARHLLKNQKPEGWWLSDEKLVKEAEVLRVWDTCFAILFLRRATQALPKVHTQ